MTNNRATRLLRRALRLAVLLAAADPALPPAARIRLVDGLPGPDPEADTARRRAL
ncbi:hypothetical protein K7640_05275 [Micromonospora sp. PLK6-60]|uniref:hypothetical protein n=1 Tax=Micromonospora sp. PLK6-60 TaxID=2873383 RepID=UPI001CA63B09|nr:hypothetical protein [Micromonospora sp. PLK6-60]MBY8871258.1 hypothetical protein [Micromonospora sp. PLK6-60]